MSKKESRLTEFKISETLIRIGAINKAFIETFSTKTRDNSNLTVYRDTTSKVIYIDNFYVGNNEYSTGDYTKEFNPLLSKDFEDVVNTERRINSYKQFIIDKSIVDFGCGAGSFLKQSKCLAKTVIGVELQENYVDNLNKENIKCKKNIEEIEKKQDCAFLFHCLEHLPNPIDILQSIHEKLKEGGQGKIIIEVPHAKDFLIESLNVEAFVDFTLWSQHLVLHTSESLRLLLEYSGFKNVTIQGVQRYSIANHLNWLMNNRPGGHKDILSAFETQELVSAYAYALSKIDANDTLVAIAQT